MLIRKLVTQVLLAAMLLPSQLLGARSVKVLPVLNVVLIVVQFLF